MMTTLAPPFYTPNSRNRQMAVSCRPVGLVSRVRRAVPRSHPNSPFSTEWSLHSPVGVFFTGVGHARRSGEDRIQRSLRETILARMSAGHSLEESVQTPSRRLAPTCVLAPSATPLSIRSERRWRSCGRAFTPRSSMWRGASRPLCQASAIEAGAQTFELRGGDALLFVAHPTLWERHLLGMVDRSLHTEGDDWSEPEALRLCGEVSTLFKGDSSSVLLYRPALSSRPIRSPASVGLSLVDATGLPAGESESPSSPGFN